MRALRPSLVATSLAIALVVTACAGAPTASGTKATTATTKVKGGALTANDPTGTTRPSVVGTGTTKPTDVAAIVGKTRLTGQVRLLSDQASTVISDNGGAIVSNHAAGIISNNTGGIISDNGGGVIANNGGSIVANNGGAYRLKADVKVPAEYLLADAEIQVFTADGKSVLGGDGQPLKAKTDATGKFVLDGDLTARNVVLRVSLFNSGELSAIVPRGGGQREITINTATTMGATYVLDKYVKGNQSVFDRLPAEEAERLTRELATTRAQITTAPSYKAVDMVSLTDKLRQSTPALNDSLETIRTLLLGQLNLGEGLAATHVAIFDVRALALDGEGRLLMGEHTLGRIRRLNPDGTIETWADPIFGTGLKQAFPGISDMLADGKGGVYIAAWGQSQVLRVTADGKVSPAAGTDKLERGPLEADALKCAMIPQSLALDPTDNTLLIGEAHISTGAKVAPSVPRVIALDKAGVAHQLPFGEGEWGAGRVTGVARAKDGTTFALYFPINGDKGTLYRLKPGASKAEKLAEQLSIWNASDIAAAPNGDVYVAASYASQVLAIRSDGSQAVVAGKGGPPGTTVVFQPKSLMVTPDGSLFIGDTAPNIIYKLGTDGKLVALAGTNKAVQTSDGNGFAFNFPSGTAFDPQGHLVVVESGASKITRVMGDTLETLAGSLDAFTGDGGPARDANLSVPQGIVAIPGGGYFVADTGNYRIRRIDAAGTITTWAGADSSVAKMKPLDKGKTADTSKFPMEECTQMALDDSGRLYVTSNWIHQVLRISADGKTVEAIAGKPHGFGRDNRSLEDMLKPFPQSGNAMDLELNFPVGLAFSPDKKTLYVADTGTNRILALTNLDSEAPQAKAVIGIQAIPMITADGYEKSLAENNVLAEGARTVAPSGLAVDASGTLYFSELGAENRQALSLLVGAKQVWPDTIPPYAVRIRKITPDGKVSTIAGPGGTYFTNSRGADAMVLPAALALDPTGKLVILDTGANQVRILPAGKF